jgi:hypothetical protein
MACRYGNGSGTTGIGQDHLVVRNPVARSVRHPCCRCPRPTPRRRAGRSGPRGCPGTPAAAGRPGFRRSGWRHRKARPGSRKHPGCRSAGCEKGQVARTDGARCASPGGDQRPGAGQVGEGAQDGGVAAAGTAPVSLAEQPQRHRVRAGCERVGQDQPGADQRLAAGPGQARRTRAAAAGIAGVAGLRSPCSPRVPWVSLY